MGKTIDEVLAEIKTVLALSDFTDELGRLFEAQPFETESGQRVGLVLDAVACMAGPVRALVAEFEALKARVTELEAAASGHNSSRDGWSWDNSAERSDEEEQ